MDFFSFIIQKIALIFYKQEVNKFLTLLSKTYYEFKKILPLQLSPNLIRMLIQAEDKRFYQHGGVDFKGILRAVRNNLFYNKREGGSTIQQQLVRVITGRYEFSLKRKYKEILLATTVLRLIPKNEIPSLYLFIAYYGWKSNGIIQLRELLGLDLSSIDDYTASSIIARLKYPAIKLLRYRNQLLLENRARFIFNLYIKMNNESKNLESKNEIVFSK